MLRAVFKEQDLVRRRHHSRAGEVLAEECVEEGGFADIHFTDDHKDKGLLQTGDKVIHDGDGFAVGPEITEYST